MKFNIGKYVLSVAKNTKVIDDHNEIKQTIIDSMKILGNDVTCNEIRKKMIKNTEAPTLVLTVPNCVLASKLISDSNILAVRKNYNFDVFEDNILEISSIFELDNDVMIYDIFYDSHKMETYVKFANREAVMDVVTEQCTEVYETQYFEKLVTSAVADFKYEENLEDMFLTFNIRLNDQVLKDVGYAYYRLDVVDREKVSNTVLENLRKYIQENLDITNFDPNLLDVTIAFVEDDDKHVFLVFNINYKK